MITIKATDSSSTAVISGSWTVRTGPCHATVCPNCGVCDKPDFCQHCGICKNCGKFHNHPVYNPPYNPWLPPNYPYYPYYPYGPTYIGDPPMPGYTSISWSASNNTIS